MSCIKREGDVLSADQRRFAIDEIIAYFSAERNEKIGVVAAGHLLDFFLRIIGSSTYNKALDDVRPLLEKHFGDTLLDIDVSLRKMEERRTNGGK